MSAQRLQQLKGHILADYKVAPMAEPVSPLSTHVLNISLGVPGSNMALSLHRQDPSSDTWSLVTNGITNHDGRCPGLITKDKFIAGVYKLRYETQQYWESIGETSFYPYVEVKCHSEHVLFSTLYYYLFYSLAYFCVADCLHYKRPWTEIPHPITDEPFFIQYLQRKLDYLHLPNLLPGVCSGLKKQTYKQK
uniref:Transthyretin n=1 Tax=Neogobius melanostomus TaxID=47308 RepID=A0A8C6WGH1_9GOBI